MSFKSVRKRIAITVMAGAILIPSGHLVAAELGSVAEISKQESKTEIDANALVNAIAEIQKQENTEKILKIESKEEIKFQSMVSGKSFVTIAEDAALVMESADENSAMAGKVYRDSVVRLQREMHLGARLNQEM